MSYVDLNNDPIDSREHLVIDGRNYDVQVRRRVSLPLDAPRLIIVSRQVNAASQNIVKTCVRSIEHFTPEPHELWVVDNNSPIEKVNWLLDEPSINVAFNRTEPRPSQPAADKDPVDSGNQMDWGSYANAIALEIGARLVDPGTAYFMTLHMDTMATRSGWLTYLRSKIKGKTRSAGFRFDKTRIPEGVLHVLGYIVDFQLFQRLKLDFLPDLPGLDVGDKVTVELRKAGYDVFACPNTLWEPEVASKITSDDLLGSFAVDRALDDDSNVIFLHLGRGVRKSIGDHQRGTLVAEWSRVAEELIRTR